MNRQELAKYKSELMARKAETIQSSRRREEIQVERAADAADEVTLASGREFAMRLLDSDARKLKEIQAALDRIQDKSYGICLACEEKILPKRLNAVPWASYCVSCQEKHDRMEREDVPIEFQQAA